MPGEDRPVAGDCGARSIETLNLRDWSACMRELSLHILDALQNSLEAGATLVELTVDEDLPADRLTITVRDNGQGMDQATLARATDPFFTTRKTRHVGLGIPLFKAATERCNGDFAITSAPGKGATLVATFQHSHIDRAPLGDMVGTLLSFILGGMCDVRYVHRRRQGDKETRDAPKEFAFDTREIKAELGDVPLTHPAVREWLRQLLIEEEAELSATA